MSGMTTFFTESNRVIGEAGRRPGAEAVMGLAILARELDRVSCTIQSKEIQAFIRDVRWNDRCRRLA